MSDLVEAAVYQREAAWHGKGRVVDSDLRDWADVKAYLDIDWDIEPKEVYTSDGIPGYGTITRMPDYFAAVRTDSGEVLAVNRTGYVLVGIEAFGRFVEAAMSDSAASWDAFNVLDGGRAVCATIKLDEPIQVPGDASPVFPYVGFSNRIDAKGALLASPTAIRQVCWNTNTMFVQSVEGSGWSTKFRHTRNLDLDMAAREVSYAIGVARQAFEGFAETAKQLAETTVVPERFVSRWLPLVQGMDEPVIKRVEAKRDAFWGALNGPLGMERKDTGWAVLQAAVDAYQYGDAFPTRGEEGRVRRSVSMIESRGGWGRNDDLGRAHRIAMELVR